MEQPQQVSAVGPGATPVPGAEADRGWDRPVVVIPLLIPIALVGGLFGSFTFSANMLVLVVGGTLLWLGLTGRAGRRSAPRRLSRASAWWLVPVLLFAAVELFAFSKNSIENYPTLSLLADPILDVYPARAACYFGWLAAFWGLIRR